MKVYLCYLTRTKKEKLVKICSTFDQAKEWQRKMNKITRQLMYLTGKYYLHITTTKHEVTKKHHIRKSKVTDNYFDFISDNKLDGTESLSSAYFHEWDVNN